MVVIVLIGLALSIALLCFVRRRAPQQTYISSVPYPTPYNPDLAGLSNAPSKPLSTQAANRLAYLSQTGLLTNPALALAGLACANSKNTACQIAGQTVNFLDNKIVGNLPGGKPALAVATAIGGAVNVATSTTAKVADKAFHTVTSWF